MKQLTIDIETYSDIDIAAAGSYRYAQSPEFEILLLAYKFDDEPTQIVDLKNGESIPPKVRDALNDPAYIKRAYNAAFEWYCLNLAGIITQLEQWECTMVHALYNGYPGNLAATGKAIGLPEDKQKMSVGKALIRYFCMPCKATKSNGGRTRNLPHHEPEKWEVFKTYCIQDVESEYAIDLRLADFPVPDKEWDRWHRDTRMQALGVKLDRQLIEGAIEISNKSTDDLLTSAKIITSVDNPKSNAQMLAWVQQQGIETDNLRKETVADLLADDNLPGHVRTALELRAQYQKTSVTKFEKMAKTIGLWDRCRGLLQFYGANRTGRYAGRLVQVQNLPRNSMDTLDEAREMVKNCDYIGIKNTYGNVPDTLSQLIRTAFIPSEGNKFIVSDFSAIEARVIAWLAGENWVLDVFENNGDIYCATASQMFGVPVEKHGINGELRQKGKIATLALGYQGGIGALKAMGALNMGIDEGELQGIVDMWRDANPHIVQMWWDVERMVRHTISTGEFITGYGLMFRLETNRYGTSYLTIELPSGRKLFYNTPSIDYSMNSRGSIVYFGQNQMTKKWELQETYGGKLTENCVQAIARDCLVETMNRVEDAGYIPVMHIHDEIVIDATPNQSLEDVNVIFAQPIPWAPGLPLKGDGFEGNYYMKD